MNFNQKYIKYKKKYLELKKKIGGSNKDIKNIISMSIFFKISNNSKFLDLSKEQQENEFEKNYNNYHKKHLLRKLSNICKSNNDNNIFVKIYTYVIPDNKFYSKDENNIKKLKEINMDYKNFLENKIKNPNSYYGFYFDNKIYEPYYDLTFKDSNSLFINFIKNQIENINFLEIIKDNDNELDFFYNCKASGSIIDYMKLKSAFIDKENNILVIDSNTEITNYSDLFSDTFKSDSDSFCIAYYKDHLNINNKIHYTKPNSKFYSYYEELINLLFIQINSGEIPVDIKNINNVIKYDKDLKKFNNIKEFVYSDETNVIFDFIFKKICYKLNFSKKYQYGKNIQYDLNYNLENIKSILRLTKYYIPAINMSWANKSNQTIESSPIKYEDGILDIQGFLGLIKKYLISGIESNSCLMNEQDNICYSNNQIDGVNVIKKWKEKRKLFLDISDKKYDNISIYLFVKENHKNLKKFCRKSVAARLIDNYEPEYVEKYDQYIQKISQESKEKREKELNDFIDKKYGIGFRDQEPDQPNWKHKISEDVWKEYHDEYGWDITTILLEDDDTLQLSNFNKENISDEKIIETLLELYNDENEVSFFEKGKYEMCDLISNIDLVYTGIYRDRQVV